MSEVMEATMSRFLPFAAAILIGMAIVAAAHGPGVPIRSDAHGPVRRLRGERTVAPRLRRAAARDGIDLLARQMRVAQPRPRCYRRAHSFINGAATPWASPRFCRSTGRTRSISITS